MKKAVICDFRLPDFMKEKLQMFYDVVDFSAEGLVEKPLEGHPDLFLAQINENLVVATNCPKYILEYFNKNWVNLKNRGISLDKNVNFARK